MQTVTQYYSSTVKQQGYLGLDHAVKENHVIDWEGVKVIEREEDRRTRWIKEALCIRKTRNTMNQDTGTFQLSHAWDTVISGSRDTSDCTRGSDVNKMSAC